MATPSYLPGTIDGRAHWWQNIRDTATNVLTPLGYTTAQLTPILNDAAWAVYCYGSIHRYFGDVTKALTAYESALLDSPDGTAPPAPVVVPALPPPPFDLVMGGIEARRQRWVQEIKANASYNQAIGALLGIDVAARPFNPTTYTCELLEVASRSPHTVSGKFRKAGGHVDGIDLAGRKSGTAAWHALGRFNATPFTAAVPLAGDVPEEWEFQAQAVKRDVAFGEPSAVAVVIVRG